MEYVGSNFICDCRIKLFGFIPTPWVCGGIMKPTTPKHDRLRCEVCGYEKDFQDPIRLGNPERRWNFVSAVVVAMGILTGPVFAATPIQQPADHCAQFTPYGLPSVAASPNLVPVCRTAYTLLSDQQAKIPVWVAYTLTPEHALGCIKRSNAFAADDSFSLDKRSDPADYAHSGFDIGHIAPDGDMRWDSAVERESFILTNMTPQLPGLNRGLWKLLETSVRAGANETGHPFLVYAGPIYHTASDTKIGPDQVDVPTAFYKIVVDTVTGQYWAFLFPQRGNLGKDLSTVRTRESEIETQTGITFPLPPGGEETALIWAYSFKQLTNDTKAKCKKQED